MKWQPIETAPKGKYSKFITDIEYINPPKILIATMSGEVFIGYWDFYFDQSLGGAGAVDEYAWVADSGIKASHEYDIPTHWMPLPEPPGDN